MSRKMIIACSILLALVLLAMFGSWKAGWLYLRVSDARIALNGAQSADSKIYKTGTGDYLIFMETENASFPVYAVTNDGRNVGIPGGPVPSTYTKSLKTDTVVLCLQCQITQAGTSKLTGSISASESEMGFRVGSDTVIVRF